MKKIADAVSVENAIAKLTEKLYEECPDPTKLILVGIQRRGVCFAKMIQNNLKEKYKLDVQMGVLDITFYRDDLSLVAKQPITHATHIDMNLDDTYVILVDDVLYTGRTIRAALWALVDFGRAKYVKLLTIVDRGHRELPIQADYVGFALKTTREEVVKVKTNNVDGELGIYVVE